MPRVEQQRPTGTRATLSVNGSLLSQAIPVSELKDDFLRMVIYGENRVGKTTLGCQFPKPLLLLAMEPNITGGAVSVRKMAGVDYLRVSSTAQGNQLAKELVGSKYKSVVIDSATSYQDIVLAEIMNLDSVPEILSWGVVSMNQYRERSEKTRECLRPYLNLPMNVIVTAKQKDHNRQDKSKPKMIGGLELESFFAADLGGATAGWLHDACDYICRLYIEKEIKEVPRTVKDAKGNDKTVIEHQETGRLVRRLQTMYSPNHAGGFRSDTPSAVPAYINNPTYELIAKVIRGEKIAQGKYVSE